MEPTTHAGSCVLVVDDARIVREMERSILEQDASLDGGVRNATATSGAAPTKAEPASVRVPVLPRGPVMRNVTTRRNQ